MIVRPLFYILFFCILKYRLDKEHATNIVFSYFTIYQTLKEKGVNDHVRFFLKSDKKIASSVSIIRIRKTEDRSQESEVS
jgi:hypothetical protein